MATSLPTTFTHSSSVDSFSFPSSNSLSILPRRHTCLESSRILRIPSLSPFRMTMDEARASMPPFKWRRVLLKVSGETLEGDQAQNIDPKVTIAIAREVSAVTRLGIEVAIVIGGGNIFRGSSRARSSGLDCSPADYIGMLATVMNAIFLQAATESIGIHTCVQTAFRTSEVAEPCIRRRAVRHLEKGRVVIFAARTGNPFFTTDTAAALRCAKTVVLNLSKLGNIAKAIKGERVGTHVGLTWNMPIGMS